MRGEVSRNDPQLPTDFFFDGNRMQIHYEMGESLDTMHGHLGSVSKELRALINKYIELVNTLRLTSFHLIVHGDQSHFSLDPAQYIRILRASGEDAREWTSNILDAVKSPERLYSGLLAEGAGLAPCTADGLLQASYGSTSERPAMEKSVLNALLERNKTDRRLFLAQSSEPSPLPSSNKTSLPLGGRSRPARHNVLRPTNSALRQEPRSGISRQTETQTREIQQQHPRSGLTGSRGESNWRGGQQAESGSWRRKGATQPSEGSGNGQWRRGDRERGPPRQFEAATTTSSSNWRDKRQTAHNLAKQTDNSRMQAAKPLNGYAAEPYYQGYEDHYPRDYTQEYLADPDMHYGNIRGMEKMSVRDEGFDSYHEEPNAREVEPKLKRSNKDASYPGPGYVCRICGQPGGELYEVVG